ncbi:ankyrin repeat protein [Planoprotostelium fungivorum]|uniref:Ankyrin repeat protein n=1 Tax=Planoprotostelium fungivorum TaxID=1890364 RepID=A0A2P6NSD7_9EUKA|nr:ankyrin repeat protein [Planoprotostelium fungivorum]
MKHAKGSYSDITRELKSWCSYIFTPDFLWAAADSVFYTTGQMLVVYLFTRRFIQAPLKYIETQNIATQQHRAEGRHDTVGKHHSLGCSCRREDLFKLATDRCEKGDLEMCKKRTTNSWTKIDAQDPQGKTALHEEVVKFLHAEKGAKTDITTPDGTNPLHLAAMNGHDGVVEYLVKEGKVDVNIRDKDGDTPLVSSSSTISVISHLQMEASKAGKVSTMKLLVELGADKELKNKSSRNAESFASTAAATEFFKGGFMSHTKY